MSPVAALADSLAQKTANQLGVTFGSIRMWGAVGFALASLACGKILTIIGISNIMYPFLFFAIISLFLGFFVQDVPLSSKPVTLFSALHLLKNKQLLLFLTLITFISLTHRTNDNFIGLHISHLGGDASLIGWAWFIAVITEAIVFALSSLWFRRFNELTFIIIAGFFYVLRFIVIAQATDPIHVLYIQPLHGICFGLFYTAAFQYITKIVPEELQGTGHLLFVSVSFGVSGIVGSSIGGMIMEATSGSALFAALAGSALLGSIGIILCQKKLTSNSL